MSREETLPPNWIAVKIDESHFCEAQTLERCGGKIYGIYLVDTNSVTHCCEITPSYCMIPLALVAESMPEDEVGYDLLSDFLAWCAAQEDVRYMHCKDIDSLAAECRADLGLKLDPEDWQDDLRGEDNAREAYQSCPSW